ncbi:TetR/AcrR family transcriptional regulator [Arenibacter sp. BSSL-BM3]|uniref:Biofilm operon icaADBC HTH-type negative transcriptional regulator IcaR n=1 Tax=Arenibacter arenosicollis TaxID=2762274 RepID=A0ABR7QTH2_9FLAO|nr:TetR family transcriptional regulator [Arenibacter arenosicollis]MBC8770487.1 TetR/AcrR family transcriptional regulator [Arenibacter arenosicollis]
MGRKSLKKERQSEIIEAFYKVAKREGLENVSLAKVATEMDVNTSLVLHYFKSKEELLFGLINFILERYKKLYTSEYNKERKGSRLVSIINNLFSREWNELVDDGVFYSCFALIFRDEKIKLAYKELHDYLRLLLAEVIEEAKNNGEVNIGNPKETADLIFVIVEGAYYYLSLFDPKDEETRKLERYKQAAFDILHIGTTIKS